MATVASRASGGDDQYAEWWVPQWHVIDDVMTACSIHEIHSNKALEAFVTIRELFGRMRAWEEESKESWPLEDGAMVSFVASLSMNASMALETLQSELS